MPLTDVRIRTAKPREKQYKLTDGAGLYLLVMPNGGTWWRFDYRFGGKRKTLSMGTYPEVGLSEARSKRDEARRLLAKGLDPSAERRAAKARALRTAASSFETVAKEWFDKFSPGWAPSHAKIVWRRIEKEVLPDLGSLPIAEIDAPELLQLVRKIESRGVTDMARRVLQVCGQIFRYAIATGQTRQDPSFALKGSLPPEVKKHFASITDPKKIGELMRAIDGYEGGTAVQTALRLAPLVFVRPGELRHAEWVEIDFDAAEWKISAEKMKMKRPHIVPLSTQALAILEEARLITGSGRYVFPSIITATRPMSENVINAALRRLGYTKEEMTGHGFRSMASTLLNEQGWNRDVIERQLAHVEGNSVRAAYNYADYLPERREMMQAWADHLDALRSGAKVVPIRGRA